MILFELLQMLDFTAVGSTNLMPLDIRMAVIKDKLSVLILSSILSLKRDKEENGVPSSAPDLLYSEFQHPNLIELHGTEVSDYPKLFFFVQKNKKMFSLSLDNPECLGFTVIPANAPTVRYKLVNIKPDAKKEEVSLFDATRKIEESTEQQRTEELFSYFRSIGNVGNIDDAGDDAFSPYRVPLKSKRFSDSLQNAIRVNADDFESFQSILAKWYKSGFPRYFKEYEIVRGRDDGLPHPHEIGGKSFSIPSPIFYEPIGPMAYDICAYFTTPQTRLQRLFFNDGCGLHEALVPTALITGNTCGHVAMTFIPNQEMIPLWNNMRIMSKATDTVVICGCIQDAEALQRANAEFKNVAFTGFVGDKLEQIDFSPLSGKNVAFLISNHNGGSLDDAYEETVIIFEYIRDHIEAKEYAFYQRLVKYPDSTSTIATPEELASAYYHHRPDVDSDSRLLPMDEYEFNAMLAKIRQRSKPFWIKPATTSNVSGSRVDDFLVRGFLYKGMTTLFAGRSGSKKTHFALTLGRYVVAGDKPFLKDRFWTRAQPNGYPKKVVYWCFDDVSERELKKMNYIYKKNLPPKYADNFFIESAPEAVLNPDINNIQKEMMKYAFKGQLGLPVELLIIDTLSDLKGQQHTVDSLKLLADFKKQVMPDLAILVLHHITDVGNIRGGSGVKRGPRIALSLKKDKDKPDVFNLTYADSTNISLAPEEKKTFSFIFDDLEVKVFEPEFTRKEMRQKLSEYYMKKDYMKYTQEEVGILLGTSDRAIRTSKNKNKADGTQDEPRNKKDVSSDEEGPLNDTDKILVATISDPDESEENVQNADMSQDIPQE